MTLNIVYFRFIIPFSTPMDYMIWKFKNSNPGTMFAIDL